MPTSYGNQSTQSQLESQSLSTMEEKERRLQEGRWKTFGLHAAMALAPTGGQDGIWHMLLQIPLSWTVTGSTIGGVTFAPCSCPLWSPDTHPLAPFVGSPCSLLPLRGGGYGRCRHDLAFASHQIRD